MPRCCTWTADHPHAKDKTWRAPGFGTNRLLTFTWAKCEWCGVKTMVAMGAVGFPVCDECFADATQDDAAAAQGEGK